MARRWISSADVEVDDAGRIAVVPAAELLRDNRLRVDLEPVLGTGADARTLADIDSVLRLALCDYYGYPLLWDLMGDVESGLHDSNLGQPWFETIHEALEAELHDWTRYQPWLASIHEELATIRVILQDVHVSGQHALRTV